MTKLFEPRLGSFSQPASALVHYSIEIRLIRLAVLPPTPLLLGSALRLQPLRLTPGNIARGEICIMEPGGECYHKLARSPRNLPFRRMCPS